LPRSIRKLTLIGVVSAVVALVPAASASAATTVSPSTVDFGTVPVGQQSVSQVVTLTQSCDLGDIGCLTGLAQSAFTPVLGTTSGFTQLNNCPPSLLTTLVGGSTSCTIDVSFIPVVGGTINGLLNTGSGGPTVALRGSGAVASAPATTGKRKKCKKKHRRAASAAKKKCKKHKKK
jgi:hypothetical protein